MARSARLIRVRKTKGATQPQYTTCVKPLPRRRRGNKIRRDLVAPPVDAAEVLASNDRFAVLRGLEQRLARDSGYSERP